MLRFQKRKRKRKERAEKANRLYARLDVPLRKLSFYAESILIQTLDRNKMLALPDLGVLHIKRPIAEMTIRAKHINFLLCARSGYLARIKRYIVEDLVDINWTFVNGNNCLHEAILGNKLQCFDFILRTEYIDFDYANAFGWTPLSLAAFKRNYYFIFKLILRGANPDWTFTYRGGRHTVRDLSWSDPKLEIILKESEKW